MSARVLNYVPVNAPQLPKVNRWRALARYVVGKMIPSSPESQALFGSALSIGRRIGLVEKFRIIYLCPVI